MSRPRTRITAGLLRSAILPTPPAAFLALALLPPAPVAALPHVDSRIADTTRTWYVAAEEVRWDYAPAGRDEMMGRAFDEEAEVFVGSGSARIGSVYRKAVYRAYTDSAFTERKAVPPEWMHKGILGPVLRAEVGDTLRVVFRNLATRPYSMHPHGVFYRKDSEGAPTNDGTSGRERDDDAVPPGGTHTYVWPVPERAGPLPGAPSSKVWLYHSHVSEPRDTNAGLVGAIVVTRRGEARPDGAPADVDREFISLFKVFDENASWYLDENRASLPAGDRVDPEDEAFVESNLMHAINGWVFGSLPLLEMTEGERVRWYLVDLGTEVDLHTAHWHGNIALLHPGRRTDVVELLPGSMRVADMVPDNPGIWMYHCHVDDHITAGMTGRYRVHARGGQEPSLESDRAAPPPGVDPPEVEGERRPDGRRPAASEPPSPTASGSEVEREAFLMGTRLRLSVDAGTRARSAEVAEGALRRVEGLERLMTTWSDASEMSRLNRAPIGAPVRPSPGLFSLLDEAFDWARRTGGTFEPSVGALVDAWGLRTGGARPPPAAVRRAVEAVGAGAFEIDRTRGVLIRHDPAAWIDTGGFGKGAALRAVREEIARSGARGVVDFGGQLLVVEPDGRPAEVAVAHPGERTRSVARLRLRGGSVATSGGSERPGHLLDPRSGRPVAPWGSVTVVSDDPLTADVLATALYVMGPVEGLAWAETHPEVGVLFIEETDDGLRASWTPAMERHLVSPAGLATMQSDTTDRDSS